MHDRADLRQRRAQRGGPADRRARARRPQQGVLHQRRRRGHRERDPDGAPAHRPAQGARHLPQLPRRDRRGDRAHRRSAALARASPASPASCTSGARTPTARPFHATDARQETRARAAAPARHDHGRGPGNDRRDHPRDRRRHERHPRAAARLPRRASATICDEFGIVLIADEVMAGFGRCGEWFAVDHWGVTPDLITLRQGRQLRLRPARRRDHLRRIAATFADRAYPGGLTYSGHPLACASAVASINIFKEEGIVEHARALGTDVIGPGPAPSSPPSTRRSARCAASACSGRSSWSRDRETREPLVPFNAAGADAGPMDEFAAACKQRGLWPFIALQPHPRRAARARRRRDEVADGRSRSSTAG